MVWYGMDEKLVVVVCLTQNNVVAFRLVVECPPNTSRDGVTAHSLCNSYHRYFVSLLVDYLQFAHSGCPSSVILFCSICLPLQVVPAVKPKVAISDNLGFGGHNAALSFKVWR